MESKEIEFLNIIAQAIFDKKGFNILGLDVRGISSITDFVIIAEGNVNRHVCAIAHAVIAAMKASGSPPLFVEGMSEGDWVVVDCGFVMVHIFQPGLRDKFQLEQLWESAEIIDLTIDVATPHGVNK